MYDFQTAKRNGDPSKTQKRVKSEIRRAKNKAERQARKISRGSNQNQKKASGGRKSWA